MTNSVINKNVFLGVGGIIALLLVNGVLTYRNIEQLHEDSRWVAHTHEVIDSLESVHSHLRAAESIQRTYLILGGDELSPDFNRHIDAARSEAKKVLAATSDNADQQFRLPDLIERIEELQKIWWNTATIRKNQGFKAAQESLGEGRGTFAMAELLRRFERINNEEEAVLKVREEKTHQAYRNAVITSLVTTVAGLASVVLFFWLVARYLRIRQRAVEQIHEHRELLQATLASVGDAVIATNLSGKITFFNSVAQQLTGWYSHEAIGCPLGEVFHVVAEGTRQPVENPALRALNGSTTIGIPNHALLVARDGSERPIDDCAAPIRNASGVICGAVLVFRDVTQHRKQQRELQEREREFRTLAESLPQLCWMAHADGHIFWYNQRWYEYTGTTLEQMAGWGWQSLHDPDALPEVLREWNASLISGTPFEMVFPIRGANGRFRQFLTRVEPIKDESGTITRWFGTNTDVTASVEVEEKLRASEQHLRAVLDTLAAFVGVLTPDGILTQANSAALRAAGLNPEDVLGKPFAETYWWSYSPRVQEDLRADIALARRGQSVRRDVQVRAAEGELIDLDFMLHPMRDEHGEVTHLIPSAIDITERKRGEADRLKLVSLVENSTDFIGMCDLNNFPFYINQAGLDMMGFDSLVQAQSVPIREFFFSEDQDRIVNQFLPNVLHHGHGEVEVRFRHFKTGSALWMLYRVFTLTDANGQPIGLATVSRDVTQHHQLEDNLRSLAADLSEANRRKDEFLATLAHELRNPLAPIRNGLFTLRRQITTSDPTTDGIYTMLERQLEHLVRLVDDLLDLSRITRNKVELRKETVDLTTVLSSAIETSSPLLSESGNELHVTWPEQPILLDADLTRLAQVFSNLLNNAAKYNHEGGSIYLSTRQEDNQVVVSVRDSGIGLEADKLSNIFEMFTQVDRSLEKAKGGLGIGLTLVKRLVELHGGSVEARSEGLGRGSEFLVTLPILPHSGEPSLASQANPVEHEQKALRILVVDDNRDNAESLGMILEMLGHETTLAFNGLEAVSKAQEFQPDVILLDIGLPGLNGYEACRRIRDQAGSRPLTILAQTGWGQEEDRQRTRDAGFDEHLIKPIDPGHLRRILAQVAQRRGNLE